MKTKLGYWSVAILSIIGGFQLLSYIIQTSGRIDALFNSAKAYEIKEEKYNDGAKRAYSTGRLWGDITAKMYESDGIDDFPFNKDEHNFAEIGSKLFERRAVDFYCWGADDCGDLPTVDDMKKYFGVDFGSPNMPLYSFRSGYINAFIEYFDH